MYKTQSFLAIITARGGSKGLPRKNIKQLAGKPLINWTIEAAKKSQYLDRIVLSSEDAEIVKVAKDIGCEVPFLRPLELAQDDSKSVDVVIHMLQALEKKYDFIVLLQPTSPMRKEAHIDAAIVKALASKSQCCVSVTANDKPIEWSMSIESNELFPTFSEENYKKRRQDLPVSYYPNGAVYVVSVEQFLKYKSFYIPGASPLVMSKPESCDIDDLNDFKYAEWLISQN